ncbi:galectin-4-like [Syngnathus acus]|uniref:galectin-4-like n=1 Tax=Syngnathus acus TaxID=161584 RepID=UPI001885B48F|nr:galectin-4-like [Syngnathus acus]
MVLSFAAWFLIALALRHTCVAVSMCPTGWQDYNNHCYFFGTDSRCWTQAEDYCVSKGGHLASIRDQQEQDWLTQRTVKSLLYWIGLRHATPEGSVWEWTDGTPFSYSVWYPGQPDNNKGEQNCGEMRPTDGGRWHDYECDYLQRYICKLPKGMCASPTNGAPCSSQDMTCECKLAMTFSATGGFQGVFGGLSVGRKLVIEGQSTREATKLVINLDVRESSGKETGSTALHLNFNFGTKSFIVNAKVSDKWGSKLTGSLPQQHPFGPGLAFKIVIKCGSGAFQLTFNGEPQQDFDYQVQDLQSINWLLMWQVTQSHVRLM